MIILVQPVETCPTLILVGVVTGMLLGEFGALPTVETEALGWAAPSGELFIMYTNN